MNIREEISSQFVRLIESIANSKMKKLDFGEGVELFRGEIHLIKAIGDQPGIFISELARLFLVSRAVVSKNIGKLEAQGFVRKTTDPDDKKRIQLFLTDEGEKAFRQHRRFHEEKDAYMYEFLKKLSEEEAKAISKFLRHAQSMVDHHF